MTVQALFDRCQDRRTLVLNEDDEKLRRLCLAGVATDNVNVVWTFIEGLTRVKGDRFLPLNLHYDGAFQHINECVRVMAMDGVHCARRILDDQHRALFPGEVGEVTREHRRHLRSFWGSNRSRKAEEECAHKKKSMHDAIPYSNRH